MATYVTLVSWTEQGVKNAQDTTRRAREFSGDVERRGGKVLGLYWTQGRYDIVAIVDFPDEQAAMAELLALGRIGNVRTETLRAFSESEMEQIIQKV